LPKKCQLYQNYPNPFNSETTITITVPKQSHINLDIFSIDGEQVATLIREPIPAGQHHIIWNARGMPSGAYLYRLQAGNITEIKKCLLLK
jgi:hypothetical protein